MIGSLRSSGTITAVSLRLSYLIFRQVLELILLLSRSSLWVPEILRVPADLVLRGCDRRGMIGRWR